MDKISLSNKVTHRYFAPKKTREIPERKLKYADALKLAKTSISMKQKDFM